MTIAPKIETSPDYASIKTKQNAAWASGDYSLIGMTLQITGENLAEAMDIRSGSQVLDVAAGNGNFTLSAARRWADVTSTDYVQSLLDRGKRRAEADGLDVTYQIVDAENLPFENGSFDAVGSTFGVMFSPNQRKSASEMLRVCKKGGKIGLANWTPEGFIGAVFKVIGQYVPPPVGLNSPALWGTRSHLEELFGEGTEKIEIETRDFDFRYHRSLDGNLQDILWTCTQSIRCDRCFQARTAYTRFDGGHQSLQCCR